MKRVYVLIVNWNGWRDTIECLESVFSLDYSELRVIVCDNGSDDDSVARIIDWAKGQLPVTFPNRNSLFPSNGFSLVPKPISFHVMEKEEAEQGGDFTHDPDLILIRTGANLGFAGGNNVGLRFALAKNDFAYVWLLNNDTVVEKGALQALVSRMVDKPKAGMCGSTLALYSNPNRIQARGGGWYCKWLGLSWHLGQLSKVSNSVRTNHVEKWMDYVVGASMLVSRSFLDAVGLMCEDYFLYFEELDWSLRGKDEFVLAYAPDSRVYHKVGRSIGTRSNPRHKSLICDYYTVRNRLIFTKRFFPEAMPFVYISVFTALCVRLLTGQQDRVAMIWKLLIDPYHDRASGV